MNCVFYLSLLLAITFNDVFGQINNFKNALMNDVNETCILQHATDVIEAANYMDKCISDGLEELHKVKHELNHNEERIALICKNALPQSCESKFVVILSECLSEDLHNITKKVLHMYFRFFESLCDNDAENYRELLENDCNTNAKIQVDREMAACDAMFDKDKETIHLKDFFNEENCKNYQEFYDCQKEIKGICPKMEKAIHGMFDAMAEVSPCNTQE